MSERGLYVRLKSHLFLHWFKINSSQCLEENEIKKSSIENQKKAACKKSSGLRSTAVMKDHILSHLATLVWCEAMLNVTAY